MGTILKLGVKFIQTLIPIKVKYVFSDTFKLPEDFRHEKLIAL